MHHGALPQNLRRAYVYFRRYGERGGAHAVCSSEHRPFGGLGFDQCGLNSARSDSVGGVSSMTPLRSVAAASNFSSRSSPSSPCGRYPLMFHSANRAFVSRIAGRKRSRDLAWASVGGVARPGAPILSAAYTSVVTAVTENRNVAKESSAWPSERPAAILLGFWAAFEATSWGSRWGAEPLAARLQLTTQLLDFEPLRRFVSVPHHRGMSTNRAA